MWQHRESLRATYSVALLWKGSHQAATGKIVTKDAAENLEARDRRPERLLGIRQGQGQDGFVRGTQSWQQESRQRKSAGESCKSGEEPHPHRHSVRLGLTYWVNW